MPVQQFEHSSGPEGEGVPAGNQQPSYCTEAVGIDGDVVAQWN
jgi:hypothetical protein